MKPYLQALQERAIAALLESGYRPPKTIKLVVREYLLGEEVVSRSFGPVFHAFLLITLHI